MTSTATRDKYRYVVESMGSPPRSVLPGDLFVWPDSLAPRGALARMASLTLIRWRLPLAANRRLTWEREARRIAHYHVYRASAPAPAPFSQIFRSRK